VTVIESIQSPRLEARWPVALTLLAVAVLLMVLPGRIRLLPVWASGSLVLGTLVLISGVAMTRGQRGWLKAERWGVLLLVLIAGTGTAVNLVLVILEMLHHSSQVTGLQLLTSSVAIWATNALAFSLLYWELDRGGPEARLNGPASRPDWFFQQEGVPEQFLSPTWTPRFVDYLFLGFSTATAFSPTAAMPLTPRAMLLMMLESSLSLVTIIVVAARSINILGS
jgi:hypothetical protein